MADGHYNGEIQNRDGKLKMYTRPRNAEDGKWITLANFTLRPKYHAVNELDQEGEYMIFECVVNGGKSFWLPLTEADLDSNSSVYSVISKIKRSYNGMLNKELLGKGSTRAALNQFIDILMQKYRNNPTDQSLAIVTNRTGFLELKIGGQKVEAYVIGPNSIIPVSPAHEALIKSIKHHWVGPKNSENLVLPKDIGNHHRQYLIAVLKYHGRNKATVPATFAYAWLTMYKPQLHINGIKIGVAHVVGDISTGKSSLRHHAENCMPRIQTKDPANDPNKESLMVREDSSLSVYSLSQKIRGCRHLLIQDPPVTELREINQFLDQVGISLMIV